MVGNPYQQYQSNAVFTASKGELTLMLYNGMIKFLNQAIECQEKKQINGTHNALMKTQAIITELRSTLDFKYEVGKQMEEMYLQIDNLLIEANMTKDIELMKEIRELLREYRDLWKEVMNKTK